METNKYVYLQRLSSELSSCMESPSLETRLNLLYKTKNCNIYSFSSSTDDGKSSILLVSVQLHVSLERSNLESREIAHWSRHYYPWEGYWRRLSPDETLAAKLETSSVKKAVTSRVNLDYFPSGSFIDALSASLLSRFQVKNIRGTLVVSWPEFGPTVIRFVGALLKNIVSSLDVAGVNKDLEKYSSRKDAWIESDLYTWFRGGLKIKVVSYVMVSFLGKKQRDLRWVSVVLIANRFVYLLFSSLF